MPLRPACPGTEIARAPPLTTRARSSRSRVPRGKRSSRPTSSGAQGSRRSGGGLAPARRRAVALPASRVQVTQIRRKKYTGRRSTPTMAPDVAGDGSSIVTGWSRQGPPLAHTSKARPERKGTLSSYAVPSALGRSATLVEAWARPFRRCRAYSHSARTTLLGGCVRDARRSDGRYGWRGDE